jgi:ribosomal protein S18 acetylase RimI-like enzyme
MSISKMLQSSEKKRTKSAGTQSLVSERQEDKTGKSFHYLEFDSQLFGKHVYSFECGNSPQRPTTTLPKPPEGAELVYVKSLLPLDEKKLSTDLNSTIGHVDEKVVYKLQGVPKSKKPVDINITTNVWQADEYNDLLSLFWQSAEYSRFKCDINLEPQGYDRSLKLQLADEVYIVRDKKPIGILTVSFRGDEAEVGILSVDIEHRGKGIASGLLSHLVERCAERQAGSISIPTQRANKQACALYQKNGYTEAHSQFIYHCWTNIDKIAAVIPVYGSPDSLPELCTRLSKNLALITRNFEIVLVDDHCPYNSWSVVEKLCERHSYIKGIRFSKNFGQHYAIMAGLKNTNADYVVIMDCDLQDEPEEIPELYRQAKKGFDKVLVRRIQKKHSPLSRMTSFLFYKFLSNMTDTEQDASVGNFGIYSRKVIDLLCDMPEKARLLPVHARWENPPIHSRNDWHLLPISSFLLVINRFG